MDMPFFSCVNCKHSVKAENPTWSECAHPAVAELKFEGRGLGTYTNEDLSKLERLVNDILKLQVTHIGGEVKNFEFPFQYESVWIHGCDGFEATESRPAGYYKWNKWKAYKT